MSEPAVSLDHEGVTLGLDTVGFDPVRAVGDRAFFTNVAVDSDAVFAAARRGAEMFLQLRSPDSPERFDLSLTLPLGGTVAEVQSVTPIPGDPPRSLVIRQALDAIAYIRPPVAYDSDGVLVESRLALEGQNAVLEVDTHPDHELGNQKTRSPSNPARLTGLRAGPVELRRDTSHGYSSEVSCWLYVGDSPEDFIEFEVYRRGELVVDLAALPGWLDRLLEKAIRDA